MIRMNARWPSLLSTLWLAPKKPWKMLVGGPRQKKTSRQQFVPLPNEPFPCTDAHIHQGVYIGSGIGSLDDVYETSINYEAGVSEMLSKKFLTLVLMDCRVTKKYHLYSSRDYSSILQPVTYLCDTGLGSVFLSFFS